MSFPHDAISAEIEGCFINIRWRLTLCLSVAKSHAITNWRRDVRGGIATQKPMSAKGQKPTLVGYSITLSALPRSEVWPRSRQIARCVPPPNATNRNAKWQRSIRASKSPESSGKTQRHLLGAPIACSLRSSWPRENRQLYRLRSPGNFTELLEGTRWVRSVLTSSSQAQHLCLF